MHRFVLASVTLAAGLTASALAHAQQSPPPPPPPPPQQQPAAGVEAQVQIGQPVNAGEASATAPQQPQQPAVMQPQQPVYMAQAPAYYYMPMRPVPYNGGPIPPNMHVESRPMTGLAVAGGAVFGGFYLPTAIIGLSFAFGPSSGYNAWLAAPIFGPLVWAGEISARSSFSASTAWPLAIILSIGQTAGAAMFIGGMAARREYLVQGPGPNRAGRRAPRSIAWQFAPAAPDAAVGFSVGGTHF